MTQTKWPPANPGRFTVEAQKDPTYATLKVSDAAGNQAVATQSVILGTANSDTELAGSGNSDFIYGFGDDDTITGNGGADSLYGGEGLDTVDYSNAKKSDATSPLAAADTGITLILKGVSAATVDPGSTDVGADAVSEVENIIGTSGKDTLSGDDNNNVITGGAGADNMTGGAGRDRFVFAATGDTVVATSANIGSQSVTFANGVDVIKSFEYGENGDEFEIRTTRYYGDFTNYGSIEVRDVGGGVIGFALNHQNSAQKNIFAMNGTWDGSTFTKAESGIDWLVIERDLLGADGIWLGLGVENAIVFDYAPPPTLISDPASVAANVISAEVEYDGSSIGDLAFLVKTTEGTTRLDTSVVGSSPPFALSYTASQQETSALAGELSVTDGTLTDSTGPALYLGLGTAENDTLDASGSLNKAALYGFGGSDILTGSAQADIINGGADADTIAGGAGADTLVGGAGDDTYVYTSLLDGAEGETIKEVADGGTDTLQVAGQAFFLGIGGTPQAPEITWQMSPSDFDEIEVIEFVGDGSAVFTGAQLTGDEMTLKGDADAQLLGVIATVNGTTDLSNIALGAGWDASDKILIQGFDGSNETMVGTQASDEFRGLSGGDTITGLGGADLIYLSRNGREAIDDLAVDTIVYTVAGQTAQGNYNSSTGIISLDGVDIIYDFQIGDIIDLYESIIGSIPVSSTTPLANTSKGSVALLTGEHYGNGFKLGAPNELVVSGEDQTHPYDDLMIQWSDGTSIQSIVLDGDYTDSNNVLTVQLVTNADGDLTLATPPEPQGPVSQAATVSGEGFDQISADVADENSVETDLFFQIGSTRFGSATNTGDKTFTVSYTADPQVESRLEGELTVTDGTETDTAGPALYLGLGTRESDTLSASGSSNKAALYGFDGDDTLTGGAKVDVIIGDLGSDTLTGNAGADTLVGGDGDDVYVYTGSGDVAQGEKIIELQDGGNDTLRLTGFTSFESMDASNFDNVEVIQITEGAVFAGAQLSGETILLKGGDFGQTLIVAVSGENSVDLSTMSPDESWTSMDVVQIDADSANNNIVGSQANDRISAGAGADSLTGGGGSDKFAYSSGDSILGSMDSIIDLVDKL